MGGNRDGRESKKWILATVSFVAVVAAIVCLVLLKGVGSDIAGAVSAVLAVLTVSLQILGTKSQSAGNEDRADAAERASLDSAHMISQSNEQRPVRDFREDLGLAAASWRRDAVIDAVQQRISAGASPIVLCGLPGTGKTTAMCDVAEELARRRRVLTLSLEGASRPGRRHFRAALRRSYDASGDRSVHRMSWWTTNTRLLRRRSEDLVVLMDGVDPDWKAADAVAFFSQRPGTLVLVTACTRPPQALTWQTVPVRPLCRRESLDLIALGREYPFAERKLFCGGRSL